MLAQEVAQFLKALGDTTPTLGYAKRVKAIVFGEYGQIIRVEFE